MDDYFELFESEALENTKKMSDALLALEKDPGNSDLINAVRRSAHTVKGMAGTMGLDAISELAHAMEDLMASRKRLDGGAIDLLFTAISAIERMIDEAKAGNELEDVGALMERIRSAREETPKEEKETPKEEKEGQIPEIRKAKFVRINVTILDELMDLLGQLIVAKNSLKARVGEDGVGELDRVVEGLQHAVFRARLVEVSQIFEQFPRVVRELSREENKKVELIMEGSDTEMDRSMIDAISEPLVHLVRNAIDHGIETVDERLKTGKSESGRIWLRARREGEQVVVEVEDDGRGMEIDKIKRKGLEKGIIKENATEDEILNLVFLPGFSTSEKVTKVSGRGVGMDVVKRAVESFGGSVSISTERGKGTRTTLRLPFTIVVTRVFLVAVGSEIYAVPVDYVSSIIDLSALRFFRIGQSVRVALESVSVPFADLSALLAGNNVKKARYGLLVESEWHKVVLGVDQIVGMEVIVTRPLEIKSPYFSGTAVLGDGTPVLVIDPAAFLKSDRS